MEAIAETHLSGAVRLGRWWFQRRSLSPLPFFALMIVSPSDFSWTGIGVLLPIAGIVLSESVRIWAVGYAGSATRTRGDSVPDLVHAGPFRFVRNPLYLANILLYTGCGWLFGFIWITVVTFLYSCLQYGFIVRYEENILLRHFGARYQWYCERVSRWLPALSPRIQATCQKFDLRAALRSEQSTFLSMAVMGVAFLVKRFVTW